MGYGSGLETEGGASAPPYYLWGCFMLMLEISDETRAIFREARKAYANTMRNASTTGETEAERRFSEGEKRDEANEAMFSVLGKLTFEQVCALTGDRT